MQVSDLQPGDRITDPSGKLFVVVDVAGSVAVVTRSQIVHSLDGWKMVQAAKETGEIERLRALNQELSEKIKGLEQG